MHHRTIKSFVLRGGRITPRQQQGLDKWFEFYQLPRQALWDFDELFERQSDTVVEIGFGMGNSLLTMAKKNPDINYIGIEVHRAGIGSLAADLYDEQLTNVKLVAQDAVDVFKNNIAEASLSGVQIFFPDPWPKKKHHKRRLIQPEFVHLLVQKIRSGGFIHCATDWQDYAEFMLETLSAEPLLMNRQKDGGYIPKPESRPSTKFETRGQRLGHGVWDLVFVRK
ncbi:tRNA (guanosine(46)-N7)-methyltransferase TrmB [Legionella israelensis]|uniref:tRNA (guanosine(46)-N7)-methyltransferase TrmB n=1 Tax=Legionella israelensis TaxID=454 RepID=UPI00117F3863|nr:tRNA (guanosine(46)-N7)-methyltransferase TrmB [Legionella israelensis]QDP71808.1 tRNA (guanosine(46)-N7)-methyltransferase TrmB [Legionella israelensis]